MKQRFSFDLKVVNTMVGGLAVGFALMSVPLFIEGSLIRIMKYDLPIAVLLGMLWFATSRGTYITVEDGKVYGTVLFIKGKVISLSNVESLATRGTFGGLMRYIRMKCRENGKIVERGLITEGVLTKNDFRKLIEAIRSANPNIDIPEELLK